MATITVGTVTFTPAPGGVSLVNYNYTLQCTTQECALPAGFTMNVSFTGIDISSPYSTIFLLNP